MKCLVSTCVAQTIAEMCVYSVLLGSLHVVYKPTFLISPRNNFKMIFQMLANKHIVAAFHKDQSIYWHLTGQNRKFVLNFVFLMKPDNRGLNELVSEQRA